MEPLLELWPLSQEMDVAPPDRSHRNSSRRTALFVTHARHSVIGLISVRVVIVLVAMASGSIEAHAQGFDRFNSGALRCLQSGHRGVCQRALDDAEVLQRLASSRHAYPCQTLLLGVQADLILQQLGDGRGDRAISDLQAARRGCPGF